MSGTDTGMALNSSKVFAKYSFAKMFINVKKQYLASTLVFHP